ncbi:hypothetical protein A33M_1975 [Rhodovulum sp. PH10]|uniref:hypothetical protein n=1 Tax=Rhodovulum sp. PH10 TaxID=1187851 RepID=UPI00027C270B|nr:hypothetical protein [Rhodovulum sp. PH10]EJW13651.1 hypothetical protein A33M_1975 [Rhodovulum sp. PH10]
MAERIGRTATRAIEARAAAEHEAAGRQRPDARRKRRRTATIAALLLSTGLAVAGCAATDEFLNGKPAEPAGGGGGGSSGFMDRFRSLFGGDSEAEAQAQSRAADKATQGDAAGNSTLTTLDVTCPPVDIRQGAGTLQMNAPGNDQAMGLRYQATFGRTARSCTVNAGTLSIKVGVQGRLILGPAGAAGETTIPLRYAIVQEGIQPKTIWSKLYTVSVAIGPDQPNVPFTHVAEDIAVPVPSPADLDKYVIYVGFDPKGASEERHPRRGRR